MALGRELQQILFRDAPAFLRPAARETGTASIAALWEAIDESPGNRKPRATPRPSRAS